jgi:thiol-disulfide isomerase/thioredoxin
MFRKFRDKWLKNQVGGENLIRKYYLTAPKICEKIDKLPESKRIYLDIWNTWLQPCLKLLENGKFEKCKEKYTEMVETLEKEYEKTSL